MNGVMGATTDRFSVNVVLGEGFDLAGAKLTLVIDASIATTWKARQPIYLSSCLQVGQLASCQGKGFIPPARFWNRDI